jgi:hypothetical protein
VWHLQAISTLPLREADVRIEFITGGERIPLLEAMLSAFSELKEAAD